MSNVEFHIGEVISNPNVSTYEYVDSNKFQISVKTYTDFYNQQEILAIPLNSNIKDIPRVGEHVLLVRGYRQKITQNQHIHSGIGFQVLL